MKASTPTSSTALTAQATPGFGEVKPRVSVIIPTYEHVEFVGAAIQSVLDQRYSDYEIIVIDDGSQDGTQEVVQQFGNQLRYFWQDNRGLSAARNAGIRKACAEIIALLDADDEWEPGFLERMVVELDRHPQAAAVYCGFRYIDREGEPIGGEHLRIEPPERFHKVIVSEGNWIVPAAVIFRKQQTMQVGLFNESLDAVEDADLWARMSANATFVGVPEALVRYRRHHQNMSADPERMIEASYQVIEKSLGPPEGNPRSWLKEKQSAYAHLYRSATVRHLAVGNFQASSRYLRKLVETSPGMASSMAVWRQIARAHKPVERRADQLSKQDLLQSERDIDQLLDQTRVHITNRPLPESIYAIIKASAQLALAEEAGIAQQPDAALRFLFHCVETRSIFLLSKRFWGTAFRVARSTLASRFGREGGSSNGSSAAPSGF